MEHLWNKYIYKKRIVAEISRRSLSWKLPTSDENRSDDSN